MFHSYVNVLKKYLELKKPLRVLEYGPGLSTTIIATACPDAKVFSVEHDQKWFDKANREFANNGNVTIAYAGVNKPKSNYAVSAFKHAPYDLIFVDGRRRVECVLVALLCVRKGGVVILHDAHRKAYTKPITPLINVIEYTDSTLVFEPNGKWNVKT